jgi:hypothetical protein
MPGQPLLAVTDDQTFLPANGLSLPPLESASHTERWVLAA